MVAGRSRVGSEKRSGNVMLTDEQIAIVGAVERLGNVMLTDEQIAIVEAVDTKTKIVTIDAEAHGRRVTLCESTRRRGAPRQSR